VQLMHVLLGEAQVIPLNVWLSTGLRWGACNQGLITNRIKDGSLGATQHF